MRKGRPPGSYGIDAPYVPILFLALTALSVALAILVTPSLFVTAAIFLACALSYLYATLRGKFVGWNKILDGWRGDPPSRLLDVGCGRGAVSILVARHFPETEVVGLDLWRSRDQSGNSVEAAERNASEAGVEGRIDFETGDMSEMPFPDDSFDAITASIAIQNLKDRDLRHRVISEMLRVARPGARIAIVDIQYAAQYEEDLEGLGADAVERRRLGPGLWFGTPFTAGTLVSAVAPGSPGPVEPTADPAG
ncbi:MAG: class I SAM-dependent methyltransferase [Solirubrobacterales bacterium]